MTFVCENPVNLSKGSSIVSTFVALFFLLFSSSFSEAEPLSFPPSYQRFVNDTSVSLLLAYQQERREGMIQLINRDPLIARKVLIGFLRKPEKLEVARSMAELFPQSCELELEKPFIEFFTASTPDVRTRMLNAAEQLTDAEYAREHSYRSDDFDDVRLDGAIIKLQEARAEFKALGFVDGEAYSLSRWAMHKSQWRTREQVLPGLDSARELYERTGNLRGQVFCLLRAALQHRAQSQGNLERATPLFLRASEIAKNEGSSFLGYFLSRFIWLAPKSSIAWLKNSRAEVEKNPSLRTTRYGMLLREDTPIEEYRAMLEEEVDPVLKIRANWDLYRNLADNDRQRQALETINATVELARPFKYDMSAYGGTFCPAIPWMLNERAQSKLQLGMLREAEEDCHEALRLLEQEGSQMDANYLEPTRIAALDRLSRVYRALGEIPLAIQKANESLQLSVPRGAGDSFYYSYQFLSEVYGDMGELRTAEGYLEKAFRMDSPFNPAPIHMAELHLKFQRYEEALRDLDRALQGLEKFSPGPRPFHWWETQRLRLLTEVWLRLGEPEKALVTATAMDKRNHPVEQGMLGTVLMALDRDTEAEKYFLARLDSLKEAAWPQKEVDALLNLGKICQKQKRLGEGNRYLQRALELYRQLGNRRGEMAVLLEMAESAQQQNDLRASEENSRQSLGLASELQDQQGIWSAHHRLARIALAQGRRQQVTEHLEAAVEAVEAISGNIKVDFFKMGFLEDKIQVFDELISWLGPTDPAKAFHYAERRRARAFLESRQRAGLLNTNVRGDLGGRRDELKSRLVGKQKALLEQFSRPVDQRNSRLIHSLQSELVEIREEHSRVIKEIELDSSTNSTGLSDILPLTTRQVQQDVLAPGQALLEYVVQDRESFAFLVTKTSCRFYRLKFGRKELAGKIERLLLPFSQLREGKVDLLHVSYDVGLSHELYRLLFRPVELEIQAKSQLVIVADDVLNYLPFEALSRSPIVKPAVAGLLYSQYQGVDWLIRRHTFTYALSATSLSLHHKRDHSSRGQLLAFGNPSLSGSQRSGAAQAVLRRTSESSTDVPQLVALPHADRESRRIGALMSGKLRAKVFVGEQATESEFSKEGPSADYVHFAVHSLINPEQPYYSALVLAPDSTSDGLLQAYEIINTRLNSRLVTLSGCETALGQLKKGEGMLGLQRAFLQAGTESVVVSLWSVEDSTADFMEAFYGNIRKNQNFSSALRNAKLQYLDGAITLRGGLRLSSSHPFFWAPFVLTTTASQR